MGPLGRALYNSRARAAIQSHWVLPALERISGPIRGRVIEIGAGSGNGAALIAKREVDHLVAVDLDPRMASRIPRRAPGVDVVVADSAQLPLPDEVAQFVIDLAGIHLLDPWHAILREVSRVLVPDGMLLLEQPINPLAGRWSTLSRVTGGFARKELLEAVQGAGFDIVAAGAVGPFGLDLVAVAIKRAGS